MRKWGVVISCGIALLIAAVVAVVVASRNRQPGLPPDVPVAAALAEVCVKAVERKAELVKRVNVALVSVIGAIV